MHNNQRQCTPVFLPVAMAEHGNARFYFDQPALGWRKIDSARKKECRQGLYMSSAQKTAWAKNVVGLRSQLQSLAELSWVCRIAWLDLHELILINYGVSSRVGVRTPTLRRIFGGAFMVTVQEFDQLSIEFFCTFFVRQMTDSGKNYGRGVRKIFRQRLR